MLPANKQVQDSSFKYLGHGQEKKEDVWLSQMTNNPTPTDKIQKSNVKIQKRQQKLRLHNNCWPTKSEGH